MKKKTEKSALPVSRAKTAYGLLADIRRLILAEPKRYDQRVSLCSKSSGDYVVEGYPACGTVGCVAGWTTVLLSRVPRRVRWGVGPMSFAERKLGLTDGQAFELFNETAVPASSQTAEHAGNGAAHIARFMKKHAKQLKAKRVQPISDRRGA